MQSPLPAAADPSQLAAIQNKLVLEGRFKNGINWFYWIAGLSIINTVSYLASITFTFVIGLGATQLVDGFMGAAAEQFPQTGIALRVIGVLIDLCIAALFFLFGYLGRKKYRGAVITGMVLYALDGLLLLAFQDYFGAAFHVWALVSIWSGLKALGQLQASEKPAGAMAFEPPA